MKILKIILVLGVIGALTGWYMYNKPNDSVNSSKADYTVSSELLFAEFEGDEATANAKYLDKVIDVSGTVQSVKKDTSGETNITLATANGMFGVTCRMDKREEVKSVAAGEKVRLKGICTGMLMDVVLVRCVFVND